MAQKRPFNEEVVDEVSSKHPRQDGPGDEIMSHNDGISEDANVVKLHDSGESCIGKGEVEYHGDCENANCPDILREGVEETESDAPRCAPFSHWSTSNTSVDDDTPEEMFNIPFYSGYYNFDRPVRLASDDDVYRCLLDYPPRKQVPIGPEHQADIPSLGKNTSNGDLNGTCVMLNLETSSSAHGISKSGYGRIDCICPDRGSVRCVRVHIAEARDKLRRVLGEDAFTELGFNDMGEVVADKWANEEEQLFHKVVYTNPVSLGKNFWDALSAVFPSRTKMEIVSYYFNVFMLRKRAEQNRCDPTNIDSDNDEWQGSDDDDDDGDDHEDDDSGIESPVRLDGLVFHQNGSHGRDYGEGDGDVSDDTHEFDEGTSQGHIHTFDTDSASQFSGKKSDDGGKNDVRDGSCTSSDSVASFQERPAQIDGCHDWHDYIIDSTDAKAWDGYMNCPKTAKSNVDFLPTCSMIEEVFGGDFDSKDHRW
ncbi:uncharacterized protein LOC141608206 [Silene latifolia]|uniref:uncharacterized protein LOC141608206 n=1 Tax=Silene latifolia TaxID=37657 RepID=UPI003D7725E0